MTTKQHTPEQLAKIHELATGALEWISDPAHSWLKVPVEAYKLASSPASPSSYQDSEKLDGSQFVYLEEDMDAPRWLQTAEIVNRHNGGDWYIPEREIPQQLRHGEKSPRDMYAIHDSEYVNPFTRIDIESSHGTHIARIDGTIVKLGFDTCCSDHPKIEKFQLTTEQCKDGFADILDVGYWYNGGKFEPPVDREKVRPEIVTRTDVGDHLTIIGISS